MYRIGIQQGNYVQNKYLHTYFLYIWVTSDATCLLEVLQSANFFMKNLGSCYSWILLGLIKMAISPWLSLWGLRYLMFTKKQTVTLMCSSIINALGMQWLSGYTKILLFLKVLISFGHFSQRLFVTRLNIPRNSTKIMSL